MTLDKTERKFLLILLSIVFVISSFTLFFLYQEEVTCKVSGGEIVGTGKYYTVTTMIKAGNGLVPVTNRYEITECKK